jgi:hypothetical protein
MTNPMDLPATPYGMFTDAGAAKVGQLVDKVVGLAHDGYIPAGLAVAVKTGLHAISLDHPEAMDTDVREHVAAALYAQLPESMVDALFDSPSW